MATILPKYQIAKMSGIFNCKICGYAASHDHTSRIIAHLYSKHGINRGSRKDGMSDKFYEYISKYYPNPKCACGCGLPVQIHKRRLHYNLFADGCANSSRYVNPCCPEFYLFKGLSVDDAIESITFLQSNKLFSETRKAHLSKINSGNNNPASLQSIVTRTGEDIEKIRNMLSDRSSGVNNGFYGKKHRHETLVRLAMLRSMQHKFVTRPEMILYGILMAWGIDFEYQVAIDKYIVDFLLGDGVIIEAYGDYWHSNKLMGGSKKKLDQDKVDALIAMGYKVIIIWESQLIGKRIEEVRKVFDENKIAAANQLV